MNINYFQGSGIMNKTEIYFDTYNKERTAINYEIENDLYNEKRKIVLEDGTHYVPSVEAILTPIIKSCMDRLLMKDGYTLILDDICVMLDVEDRYVRNIILPHLDYVIAPAFSGNYFINNMDFPIWKQRYLKWKKIFINKDSFIKYLCSYVYITYYDISEIDDNGQIIYKENKALLDSFLAEGLLNGEVEIIRKCNIKDIVIKEKFSSFIEKAKKDIVRWEEKEILNILSENLNDEELAKRKMRIEEEKAALDSLTAAKLNIKAYDKEIKDYLLKNVNQKIELQNPESILNEKNKSSILYIFLNKI